MVLNIEKNNKTLRIIDRAMAGHWTSLEMKNFKQGLDRMGWNLIVLPCAQHKILELECNIAMLRDMEMYFCMKGGHRLQASDDLLKAPFDLTEAKIALTRLFEAVRNNCDNYLDVILGHRPLFMKK